MQKGPLLLKYLTGESFDTNPQEGVQGAVLHVLCDDHYWFA